MPAVESATPRKQGGFLRLDLILPLSSYPTSFASSVQHELGDRRGPPAIPLLTGTGQASGSRKKPVPEGPAHTMASPQAVVAFRVQALERSRFAVGRLPAAYGDWSARPLACRSEVNGVKWLWNCSAELTTRLVSAPRPLIAVALDDRAAVGTRDFPSSPPMGDSFWLEL